MDAEELGGRIGSAWQRLQGLTTAAKGDGKDLRAVLDEMLLDLTTSLEELRVADEELREQNAELLEATAALSRERARHRALFDNAPDAYLVTDSRGVVLQINLAAAGLLRVPARFLPGKPLALFVASGDLLRFRDLLRHLEQARSAEIDDILLTPRSSPALPVSISAAADTDPETGQPIVRWLIHDITVRKQLEDDLARERDDLQERTASLQALASQMTLLEEAERRRIAVDLHESLRQTLAAVKLKISTVEAELGDSPCAAALHEVDPLLAEAIASTRSLTRDLSPPSLHTFGLEAALEELRHTFLKLYGLTIDISADDAPENVSLPIRVLLYRGARELLLNVYRHSGADRAALSIWREGGGIRVRVQDSGRGFDPAQAAEEAQRGECFGLFSIAERLKDIGGRLEIETAPGAWTTVTMVVPLPPAARET